MRASGADHGRRGGAGEPTLDLGHRSGRGLFRRGFPIDARVGVAGVNVYVWVAVTCHMQVDDVASKWNESAELPPLRAVAVSVVPSPQLNDAFGSPYAPAGSDTQYVAVSGDP